MMPKNNAIAVISDVHSNLEALESVLEDIDKHGIKDIYCLGDIVGYGASPNEVIELFKKYKIKSVRGNHDSAIVHEESFTDFKSYMDFNDHARNALKITKNLLTRESKKYLKNLKDFMVIDGVRFVHSSPPDSYKNYVYYTTSKYAFEKFDEDLCFIGHTHKPCAYVCKKIDEGLTLKFEDLNIENVNMEQILSLAFEKSERCIFNPGSVGQPRDGSVNAKYCILYNSENSDEKEIELKCVPYDINKAADKIRKIMNDDYLAERLYEGR
ncbi:metallophosphoesterase family protein [Candidatus Woesearchaeota archaeon]|nr:metallophosphoesterase family protein [Candidatus Woesearchaeota archaeon]